MKLHPKIQALKSNAAPINYRYASISESGELETRDSLLDDRVVEGYGFIWGSTNMHKERFHKGAFERSIKENGPGSGAAYELKFRNRHGHALALFEELKEDNIGLYFRTKPLDAVAGADDVLTQLRSGTLNNFSGGFNYIFETNSMKWNDDDRVLDIYNARLFEISVEDIPSDMQTYAKRSAEDDDELYDETEEFIASLPRRLQLEARHIFARHKSLNGVESLDEKLNALRTTKPVETRAIDYNYLISKL